MGFDARYSVDQGLCHLSQRLDPIIAAKLAPSIGGLPWLTVLSELDKMRGKLPKSYATTDLQSQSKATTERLGNLSFPFDDHTRLVSTLGSELRNVRNRWARHDELATLDAWCAHDIAARLLKHFGDAEGVKGASKLRDAAFNALAEEKGVEAHITQAVTEPVAAPKAAVKEPVATDVVRSDPVVLTRTGSMSTPTIGSGRFEFEPWAVVLVGDVSVPDDLPKKVVKEMARAAATEIAEFEGPIHIDRLAQLTAASFGVQRLWPAREKKPTYQIRQPDSWSTTTSSSGPATSTRRPGVSSAPTTAPSTDLSPRSARSRSPTPCAS